MHARNEGVLCFAQSEYSGELVVASGLQFAASRRTQLVPGPCASEIDLSDMNVEQKQAFANVCNAEFPCQAT